MKEKYKSKLFLENEKESGAYASLSAFHDINVLN